MPNLPGYNPDVAGHKPTTKKGQRQQSVDLQHFLALGAQKQPLIELPAPSGAELLAQGTADPFGTHAVPGPQYALENPSTATGLFSSPDVLKDILTKAGQQRVPYSPDAVPDARQALIEALSTPDPNFSGVPATGGKSGAGASYELARRKLLGDNAQAVTDAQGALGEAQRAERSRAIGNTVGDQGAGNIKKRTNEMTEDEYNALTPLQRAAVDYNTLLVDAVRKDRNHADDYNPSAKDTNRYHATVEAMFGSDRGADGIYAPETVALLKQMGVTDMAGDLNDYLSLNASIKAKDLQNLKPEDLAPGTTTTNAENQLFNPEHPLAQERLDFARDMALNTKQMEASLAKSTNLLSSINATVKFQRNNELALLGGLPNQPKQGTGWDNLYQIDPTATPTDTNSVFIAAFDSLASKQNASKQGDILAAMQQRYSDSEYKAFLDYIDQRTMNAERFKQPLGAVQGVDYLKPGELRKLLGFDQGGQ